MLQYNPQAARKLKLIKTKKLKLKLMAKRKEKLAMSKKIPIQKVINDKFFGVDPKLF
tara:strand:+ start:182 stop:352 length:171 start_codon:yes stop_codon:yes gene_type:complete